MSPKNKERVNNYLQNPTFDNWSDIAGIVITSNGQTIWQSAIKIDPSFPQTGRKIEFGTGKITKEWDHIPAPLIVLQAIRNATKRILA